MSEIIEQADDPQVGVVQFQEANIVALRAIAPEALAKELKARYGAITEIAITDTVKYNEANEGRKELKRIRTAIEKRRKEIKDPILQISKDIDAEAKRLTALFEPEETRLAGLIEAVDKEKVRIETERAAAEAARVAAEQQAALQYEKRATWLASKGFLYNFATKLFVVTIDGQAHSIAEDIVRNGNTETWQAQASSIAALLAPKPAPVAETPEPAPAPVADSHWGAALVNAVSSAPVAAAPVGEAIPAVQPVDNPVPNVQPLIEPLPAGLAPADRFEIGKSYGYKSAINDVLEILSSQEKMTRAQIIDKVKNLIKQ